MADQLKYGPIGMNATENAKPMLVTTGETFRAKSGRFVTLTTNTGCVKVADAGNTKLYGWAEIGEQVTVAGTQALVIRADGCDKVFRIPIITGTLTRAMFGSDCDLVRATVGGTTLVQGVDLTASGEDVVTIVGGDLEGNKYVDVVFAAVKVTASNGVV